MSRKGRKSRNRKGRTPGIESDSALVQLRQELMAKYSHLPAMSETIEAATNDVFERLPFMSELDMEDLTGIVCRVWNEERGVTDHHDDLFEIPDDLLYRADAIRAIEIAKEIVPGYGKDDPRIAMRFIFIPHVDPDLDSEPDSGLLSLYIAWSVPEAKFLES